MGGLVVVVLLGFYLAVQSVSPATAAFLSPGDVLVASDNQVHHYSAAGVDLGVFASDLSNASWIATDRAANVYVTEYTGNRIREFAPNGASLLTITTTYTPGGVAVATDGTFYVAHYDAGRIHHYSASRVDLGIFASYAGCDTGCGTDFIKFDTSGNLYVADFQPIGRVRLISTTGVDLGDFVNTGVDRGVEGLGFDASGNLYVSNFNNTGSCILEKFSPFGDDLGPFAAPVCYGFAFDGEGNLYSAASGGPIEKFSPSGEDLGSFGVGGRDLAIVPGPVTKNQCEKDGWSTFAFPRNFKNQGDCVSFVNTAR